MTEERLETACPGCGFSSRVPAAAVGRNARCPRCSIVFRVEAARPAPEPTRLEAPVATTPEAPVATTPEPSRPAPVSPTPPGGWRVGEVILGLYEVIGLLGQGGMGRVYKVRHRGWGLDLAVKTPLPEILEAAGGAAAFEREAETWVGLGLHPHVVTCHYVRRIEGLPCVFAEFAEGGSLHDSIASETPSLETLLDRAVQFAWGLHYAHEQGLVHRDVKPANALLASDGIVKVTDFGLARGGPLPSAVTREGGTMVVAGGAAGTPPYMSPEQLKGEPLTRRSDLWSWALSVLEMFAGGRNWDYGSAALASLEEYLAYPPPAGLPRMPGSVAELLRRSFREDPAERPHDLAAAAAVLADAYAAAAGRAYPRTPPRAGRSSADSLNNSAVSLLDLDRAGEAVALWTSALEAEPQHLEATFNRVVHEWSRGGIDDGEAERRFGEALKSHARNPRAHHLGARLLLARGDFGRAAAALDEAVRLGASGAEIAHDRALALAGHAAGSDDRSAWSRARDAFEQTPSLSDLDAISVAARAFALGKLGEGAAATTFYREATSRRSDLPAELDVAVHTLVPGLERTSTMRGLGGSAGALAVTPDGAQVVAGGGGREARLWEPGAAAAGRKLVSEDGRLRALAIAPDGRTLLW
ncbi:MAG TPA: protein kinase, partial [Vicinamibacteria bacterium]|nr:protein kinase [Vicinamibacteria bacterium]